MLDTWSPFGRFDVGIVDIEWNIQDIVDERNVDPEKHLAGRLFYPTSKNRRFGFTRSGVRWLPDVWYAYGISVFLFFRRARNIINWVLRYILFCIIYIMGSLQRLNLRGGAIPLRIEDTKYPVVVFSHGLAGNKTMYSILCSELASQGYVVLALEHADGTASVAKIAGKRGTYRFYEGLGGEVGQYDKTRHRVKEMKTAYQILRRMNKGGHIEGLKLSHGAHESGFLEGCIDMRCIAAIGHSYGGATVAALCCEDPLYRLGVCLDPWWPAVPPESSAFSSWRTKSPLLVIGSHDWNTPNAHGVLPCDGEKQAKILNACHVRQQEGERNGGGAMLVSIAGSSHNTFADPLPLFSDKVNWIFRSLGLTAKLDPVLGIHVVNLCVLNFLSMHLPLTASQRQLQSWAPSSSHTALAHVAQMTQQQRSSWKGPFWWVHKGKGILMALSDTILEYVLSSEQSSTRRAKEEKEEYSPHDIVTRNEVIETVMLGHMDGGGMESSGGDYGSLPPGSPPSFLASSHHMGGHGSSGGGQGSSSNTTNNKKKKNRAAGQHEIYTLKTPRAYHNSLPMDPTLRQTTRAHLGRTYAETIQPVHVQHILALLGEEHVFLCEAHV